MSIQRLAIGAIALLGIVTASAAPPTGRLTRSTASAAGAAPLMAFGSRSAEQIASGIGGKLDATLAELARHAGRARPGHELEDLHSMSPAAHFMQRGPGAPALIAVDAVTRGDPQRLKALLVSLGLEHPAVYSNDVGGWLPVSAIETAAARSEVHSIRAALWQRRAVVATQGDFAQGSSAVRANAPAINGSGITVGVMSDSYNCYSVYAARGSPLPTGPGGYATENGITTDAQQDVASGALPAAGVNVLKEGGQLSTAGTCLDYSPPDFLPYADEGRAMLQVVHAVAPGASLAFYTATESEADFANGIAALAAAGAKLEVDDIGYFDEPFFQDSLVAQAIDAVEAQGVAYFSAAGNDGQLAYDNDAPRFMTPFTSPSGQQEVLLDFDTTAATNTTSLPVTIPVLVPGDFIAVVVEWDQPYVTGAPGSPGASSRIDLCVTGASGLTVLNVSGAAATCTGPNATGVDPVQVLVIGNPASSTANSARTPVNFTVGLAGGTMAPGRIKLAVEDNGAGATINRFATNSPILQGHPGAAGAAAVGAAFFAETPLCGTTPALLEPYSSAGGAPTLFDKNGTRLGAPIVRQKPDFVAPDGVNTTFFGFFGATDNSMVPQCANNTSLPNYFGTSAAAPHAAGVAALMLQANAALTPASVYQILRASAVPMSAQTPNLDSGYGFIQATAAMVAPALTLGVNAIAVGNSTTLSWITDDATSCTASGSWSGTQATSGNTTLTPTSAGNETYTLACSNAAFSGTGSVTLQVEPPLIITSMGLPAGQVGTSYSATLAATGGVTPYTWSVTSGTLPAGLSLNASTGVISGTPIAIVSSMSVTFQVSDSESPAQTKMTTVSIAVAAAPSSGGGGGALDGVLLLALGALACRRSQRSARERGTPPQG